MAERLRKFEKGRIFITVNFLKTPNVPHQCGIAPVETTLMLTNICAARACATRWRSFTIIRPFRSFAQLPVPAQEV